MATKHDILILHPSGDPLTALREALRAKGYGSRIFSQRALLIQALKEAAHPIVLVDCSAEADRGQSICQALIETTSLHVYPIVVLTPDAQELESKLSDKFQLAAAIVAPYTTQDVLSALGYIERSYDRVDVARAPAPAVPPTTPTGQRSSVTSGKEDEASERLHELYREFDSVPGLFFGLLDKLKLTNAREIGREYTRAVSSRGFSDKSYLPTDKAVLEAIDGIRQQAGPWGEQHLHRTAFLSSRIIEALDGHKSLREDAKQASFLYAWGLVPGHSTLLRTDYTYKNNAELRKEFSDRLRESAMRVAVDLHNPDVANIIALAGRLIGLEEPMSDSDIAITASAIVAADYTDRVCFQRGFWDPRAAYRMLRRFKRREIEEIHPAVLCCVVRILLEGIVASDASAGGRAKKSSPARDMPPAPPIEIRLEHNEKQVSLSELSPGMRLSRPLSAIDGEVILESDQVLDEDLIWRIWQLSAIRPLEPSLIVRI